MIELKSVNKIYETEAEKVHALKSVNLNIDKGEFISIMGQSGSGKTTLMNILGCLDNPTSGEYNIYKSNIASLDDDQRSVLRGKLFGFVFQSYNLLPRLTAVEQVELPLIYQNVENRKEKALKALDMVGLIDRVDFKPSQLSGGQQQRVSIARSLVVEPKVVLADEPTGALDNATGAEVMGTLKNLVKKEGITVIIVTHESEIADYTERTISINDGKIIKDKKNK
ncbi:MAG: ABC transporter ATP-binding protein [Chloroflexota bacterium]|jgi:putative ABC transport system ATP-binding protein|nr:ABC transporter ATP-binding protein [Chloroflexota bacterium]MEE2621062.1 ABC transporter ATP-binding protein [Chloroflexota bacterium]GIR91448.1 MAG: macrolide export ATP-binding/permease protein MacB [Chloroflexota bacterium]|tara:strand:+ start:2178 stop:2852 length:675 start_codon:yes stop_codon:yes gene_type:complete